MPDTNKHFTCEHEGCNKPATRVLTYFVDPPRPYAASSAPKQDAFCAVHAESEMLKLQTPGFFTLIKDNGTEIDCTVNLLTNCPLEDTTVSATSFTEESETEDERFL